MKELTIIEKAQRYNEAIERANAAHKDKDRHLKAALERIFPELKESYGKKIRKAIQIYLNWLDGRKDYAPKGEYTIKDMIAWLGKLGNINPTEDELEALRMAAYEPTKNWSEKLQSLYEKLTHCEQGEQKETLCDKCKKEQPSHSCQDITALGRCVVEHEQKSSDKVEPKFKVGDWITIDKPCQVISIDDNENYIVQYCDDEKTSVISKKFCEFYFHFWTIQDAKDGDVLCTYECCEPKIVFILKGTPKKHYALSYHCYYNIMYPHFGSDCEKGCLAPKDEDVKPATKEQRDILMKAMADAGYTFDFEKKELKKIEQKLDTDFSDLRTWKYIVDAVWTQKEGIGQYLDSPFTEEVAKKLQKRFGNIEQKPAWSEEDGTYSDHVITAIKSYYTDDLGEENPWREELLRWLKSLKDRYTWKPSEEQILAIETAINVIGKGTLNGGQLTELLEQLKAL